MCEARVRNKEKIPTYIYISRCQNSKWGEKMFDHTTIKELGHAWSLLHDKNSKSRVFTQEKVDEIVSGLNIILKSHLDALDRRPGFKVSVFKFALFPKGTFNA